MPYKLKHIPYVNIRDIALRKKRYNHQIPNPVNSGTIFSTKPSELKKVIEDKVYQSESKITDVELYKKISSLEVLDLVDLSEMKMIGIPYLIEKLIPKWTITVLAGESATGKSTLALQICTSIIQSKSEIFGLKINSSRNKVIYVSTEDGPTQVQYRLGKQLDPEFDIELNRENFKMVYSIDKLKTEIAKLPVELIIIDTLGDFFKNDLNNNTDIRTFFDELKNLIKEYGCTLAFRYKSNNFN